MRIIKILCFLLAFFYLTINICLYDSRPKLAMVYSNIDADFQTAELFPLGQGDYSTILTQFEEYKYKNDKPNEKLYRNFKRDWTDWKYHLEYIIHPRWKLEYLPWVIKGGGKK